MTASPSERRWSVEIHHVSSHDRQQRILEAFRDIARPEVTALGSQNSDSHFMVVETSTTEDRAFARTTISVIDAHASRTYSFKPSAHSGPMPA